MKALAQNPNLVKLLPCDGRYHDGTTRDKSQHDAQRGVESGAALDSYGIKSIP